jgi:hypothetical protein
LDKTYLPPSAYNLDNTQWEVLYLLCDALDQLRKMTLSFSELRYLAVEHTEEQIRTAIEALLATRPDGMSAQQKPPLILQVPNLVNLPIYRISPAGRDLVMKQKGAAGSSSPPNPPGKGSGMDQS